MKSAMKKLAGLGLAAVAAVGFGSAANAEYPESH